MSNCGGRGSAGIWCLSTTIMGTSSWSAVNSPASTMKRLSGPDNACDDSSTVVALGMLLRKEIAADQHPGYHSRAPRGTAYARPCGGCFTGQDGAVR